MTLFSLAAAFLLVGCTDNAPAEWKGEITSTERVEHIQDGPASQHVIDYIHLRSLVEIRTDDTLASGIDLEDRWRFTSGWSPARQDESGMLLRELGPRHGAVDFTLARTAPLEMRIAMKIAEGLPRPRQRVTLFWNGVELGDATLGPEFVEYTVPIPVSAQRPGPNRLELHPEYWIQNRTNEPTSLALSGVRFSEQPGTDAVKSPVATAEDRLMQAPNTVLNVYVRLRGLASLVLAADAGPDGGGEGAIHVVLTPAGEPSRTLITRSLADLRGSAREPWNFNLTTGGSEFACVTLVYRADSDAPPIAWSTLEVHSATSTPAPVTTPRPDRPINVLMVLFDTFRADHIGAYGADNVDTPHLDALAQGGVRFAHAHANAAWTRSSLASLLTSTYETVHGTILPEDKLSDELPVLGEILQENGYRTAFTSFNIHVGSRWGFGRGYDEVYDLYPEREPQKRAAGSPNSWGDAIWDTCIAPSLDSRQPFFIYLHELDPHGPYQPNPPYDSRYAPPYLGRPEIFDKLALVRTGKMTLSDADLAYLNAQYRAEISFMDAVLGRLMHRLEQAGLRDTTLVIFLSDHGEEFMEHGGIGHGATLYQESIRVPLIWSLPEIIRENAVVNGNVALVDVAPTLLDLLDIAPPATMQGVSLQNGLLSTRPVPNGDVAVAYMQTSREGRGARAIRVGDWKLIESERGPHSDYELFDLSTDPDERFNLWTREQIRGFAMLRMLDQRFIEDRAQASSAPDRIPLSELDEAAIQQLEALGYLE